MTDDDLLPIRYLNDLLFCERRAALHLTEQIWKDNQFTTEGLLSHKRVDIPKNLRRKECRQVTGIWLVSHQLGLIGNADLIEFRDQPSGPPLPFPVDFKRGKKRRWDNNEVQLCAQAICLEEMLGVAVPRGAIFHIKSQHREEIKFDQSLRNQTIHAASRLRELFLSGVTPTASFKPKCKGCSLFEWCMPKSLRPRATAATYLQAVIDDTLAEIDSNSL